MLKFWDKLFGRDSIRVRQTDNLETKGEGNRGKGNQPKNRDADVVENAVGIKLKRIQAGDFLMGCKLTSDEINEVYGDDYTKAWGVLSFANEHPRHKVTLTRDFLIGVHPVTQTQWEKVMGSTPWKGQSQAKSYPTHAASWIGWDDAVAFCEKLSKLEGKNYRLPSEAEWEYACRAGTTNVFYHGDDSRNLSEYAWFEGNSFSMGKEYAQSVGQKRPNNWGLYDMLGNVSEWCSDGCLSSDSILSRFTPPSYTEDSVVDPKGPENGPVHVSRGGCFASSELYCRCAYRNSQSEVDLDNGSRSSGFRIVQELS